MPKNKDTYSYRGNINLKRPGTKINWTPEMIQEWIKCKEDIFYFVEKYFKIVTEEGLVNMVLRDYQRELIQSMMDNRFTLAVMARQAGKALSLDTPILTSEGFKEFRDVHKGDYIFSIDGKLTKIIFETDIMYNHECFEVEFDNGEIIKADKDHVWTVEINSRRRIISKDMTTKELESLLKIRKISGQSIRIKISNPIEYSKKELEIDPYILGLWLGDGTSANSYLTAHKDDMDFYSNYISFGNSYIDKKSPLVKSSNIKNLFPKLKKFNLIKNKHIPSDYIFTSKEDRLSLIQGLMDTDGSVTHSGSFEFYQKKYDIIEKFRFILSSLGIKSRLRSKVTNGEIYYTVSFCSREYDFFRLPRKLQAVSERAKTDAVKNHYFYIKNIKLIDSIPVKCIQVDNSSHLFLCGKTLIPTHNSESIRAFLLHYILFNDYKTVAVVADKADTAMEILSKLQLSYQNLPNWLQHGIVEFNKGSFVLENNSRIFAAATGKNSLRGYTVHVVLVDEAAHVEKWDDFYTAVRPTISAGKETKMVLLSTPLGLNHFYEFYEGSSIGSWRNKNGYVGFFVPWWRVPGRDEAWAASELASMKFDQQKFDQEQACSFIGSSGTLISGAMLRRMKEEIELIEPKMEFDEGRLKIYESPVKEEKEIENITNKQKVKVQGHQYVIVADVSRGKGLDYSAFSVFDITNKPFVQVATYRNNEITPTDYSDVIHKIAKLYNNAFVLCEINDIGEQVGNDLIENKEYEMVICSKGNGRAGKLFTLGEGENIDKGLKTTIASKKSGCLLLKLLVEQEQLKLNDAWSLNELLTFVKQGNGSYAAETGKNDDLAMTLVLFAYLSDSKFFEEIVEQNTISTISERNLDDIVKEMSKFGYIEQQIVDENDSRYRIGKQDYINMRLPWNESFDTIEVPVLTLPNF